MMVSSAVILDVSAKISVDVRIVAVLARRDWRLMHADQDAAAWTEFVAAVQQTLAELGSHRLNGVGRLDRAITYAYCPILLAACRDSGSDRQEHAFTELWQWIYPRVYARVGNAQDTKDVAQEVLVKVHQNLHQVREPHGFLGWVGVIMRREIIDYYRSKGRLDQLEQEMLWKIDDNGDDDGMDDLEGPDSFLEADVDAAEEELIRMIYDCMPKKKWRRVHALVAVALRDQTVPEVAETLGTTPAAVHLLLFRAREDLPEHCRQLLEFMAQQLTPSQRVSLLEGNS